MRWAKRRHSIVYHNKTELIKYISDYGGLHFRTRNLKTPYELLNS